VVPSELLFYIFGINTIEVYVNIKTKNEVNLGVGYAGVSA